MSSVSTILLTGASGFLGRYLLAELRARGLEVRTAGRTGADVRLDLADPDAVARAVAQSRVEAVLHAGGMTRMGECERDPQRALLVNARGSAALARTLPCLFVSTDLVFDGACAPYAAQDVPRPLSAYGRSKAAGEEAVRAAGGSVARLPLLFGRSADGRTGATDMLRGAGDRELTLFRNEFRTPLHAADAARGLVDVLLRGARGVVVHLPGPERVSRFELGQRFVRLHALRAPKLRAVDCDDALRPRDVSLIGEWACGRRLDAALRDA